MGFEFRVLKERRQWALSSVSGPPFFGLLLLFCSFSKNHKNQKSQVYWGHFGWFIWVIWLVYWPGGGLFFSTFDL